MRRRVKHIHKDKTEERHSHKDRTEEKEKSEMKNAIREELDFQFDEELDSPPPTGRHNAFSEWLVDTAIETSNGLRLGAIDWRFVDSRF